MDSDSNGLLFTNEDSEDFEVFFESNEYDFKLRYTAEKDYFGLLATWAQYYRFGAHSYATAYDDAEFVGYSDYEADLVACLEGMDDSEIKGDQSHLLTTDELREIGDRADAVGLDGTTGSSQSD